MGMSIKETIPILHDMYNYYNDVDVDAYVGFDKEDNNAMETGLEIMHKYQKIVEIVDEWKHDHDNLNYADDSYYWSKVREVIEDGNVNR